VPLDYCKWGNGAVTYEKPIVTRLGSLAEMTLHFMHKQIGGEDFLGQISTAIGGPPIGWTS